MLNSHGLHELKPMALMRERSLSSLSKGVISKGPRDTGAVGVGASVGLVVGVAWGQHRGSLMPFS